MGADRAGTGWGHRLSSRRCGGNAAPQFWCCRRRPHTPCTSSYALRQPLADPLDQNYPGRMPKLLPASLAAAAVRLPGSFIGCGAVSAQQRWDSIRLRVQGRAHDDKSSPAPAISHFSTPVNSTAKVSRRLCMHRGVRMACQRPVGPQWATTSPTLAPPERVLFQPAPPLPQLNAGV